MGRREQVTLADYGIVRNCSGASRVGRMGEAVAALVKTVHGPSIKLGELDLWILSLHGLVTL
jgi:hypothetical protein